MIETQPTHPELKRLSLGSDTNTVRAKETALQWQTKKGGNARLLSDEDVHLSRAAATIAPCDIQNAPVEVLVCLKELAGYGPKLHVWQTSDQWVVFGKREPVFLHQDLYQFALDGLPDEARALTSLTPMARAVAPNRVRRSPDDVVNETVAQAVRYLLLLRLAKSTLRGRAVKSSLAIEISYLVLRYILSIIVAKRLALHAKGQLEIEDCRHFSLLTNADLASLPKSSKTAAQKEFRRMSAMKDRELWFDAPDLVRDVTATMNPADGAPEVLLKAMREPFAPLPDDYAATMGYRSLWIIENLGPVILHMGASILSNWRALAAQGILGTSVKGKSCVASMDSCFRVNQESLDPNQPIFPRPPFPIRLSEHGCGLVGFHKKRRESKTRSKESVYLADSPVDVDPTATTVEPHPSHDDMTWRPRTYAHFNGFCAALQGAHLFLTSMALATRQSESMDLGRDCVSYVGDGNWMAEGRTFKLVQVESGEQRRWEVPEVVARAIEQQVRLVELLEQMPEGSTLEHLQDEKFTSYRGKHLWCGVGGGRANARSLPSDVNVLLRKYAKVIGLTLNPGGKQLTSHRFRKTVARLAALAIDEAPAMLQRLFGHKDVAMTLHYILTDKGLAAEIQQVIKELRIMRARKAIESIVAHELGESSTRSSTEQAHSEVDYGGYGGKGLLRLKAAVLSHLNPTSDSKGMRNSVASFGAADVYELALLLTANGTYFEVVRAGVICTKRKGELGPCSKHRGQPERSRCDTKCDYRLEEGWLRSDVDSCIEESLSHYERAQDETDDLLMTFWASSIAENVGRFPDLESKWLARPGIQHALRDIRQTKVAT